MGGGRVRSSSSRQTEANSRRSRLSLVAMVIWPIFLSFPDPAGAQTVGALGSS